MLLPSSFVISEDKIITMVLPLCVYPHTMYHFCKYVWCTVDLPLITLHIP